MAGAWWAADEVYNVSPASAPVKISTAAAVGTAVAVSTEPFVSPLGPLKGKIVSHYGKRVAPADEGQPPVFEMHEGIDLKVLPGDAVRAARSGKVLFAGFSKAYVGRKDKTEPIHLIIVLHADGTSTRYVHLNAIRVRPMQVVTAGQILGTASESDEWTVPVIHFEIRDAGGRPLNPEKYLSDLPGSKAP